LDARAKKVLRLRRPASIARGLLRHRVQIRRAAVAPRAIDRGRGTARQSPRWPCRSRTRTERVTEARERYVARGVSTPRLVVERAQGARIEDVDGRSFIDFAGGIGCQNTGHGFGPVVAAIHEQVDRYLHQCFMVGTYEPYVEVCRRLAELSPCRGADQKSLLVNSGAEAVENAVKVARAATGRPAVVVFENAFHGRTLLTMTMTSKVVPYKQGFGPFAPEVYRAAAPYPYRGVTGDDSISSLERLFKSEVDPASVACVVLEPVQGEGGFVPMPSEFPARLAELCDRHGILWVNDEVRPAPAEPAASGRSGLRPRAVPARLGVRSPAAGQSSLRPIYSV
jgi:4-aminobutyrate aminotransferase-like enzyme